MAQNCQHMKTLKSENSERNSQDRRRNNQKKKTLMLTGISATRRTNHFRLNSLKIFHVYFHAQMSEEEVSDERPHCHSDKNVSIVNHNGEHQSVVENIVEGENCDLLRAVDKFCQHWFLKSSIGGIG